MYIFQVILTQHQQCMVQRQAKNRSVFCLIQVEQLSSREIVVRKKDARSLHWLLGNFCCWIPAILLRLNRRQYDSRPVCLCFATCCRITAKVHVSRIESLVLKMYCERCIIHCNGQKWIAVVDRDVIFLLAGMCHCWRQGCILLEPCASVWDRAKSYCIDRQLCTLRCCLL